MVSESDCRAPQGARAEAGGPMAVSRLLARRGNLARRDLRVDTSGEAKACNNIDEECQATRAKCAFLGLSIAAASTMARGAFVHTPVTASPSPSSPGASPFSPRGSPLTGGSAHASHRFTPGSPGLVGDSSPVLANRRGARRPSYPWTSSAQGMPTGSPRLCQRAGARRATHHAGAAEEGHGCQPQAARPESATATPRQNLCDWGGPLLSASMVGASLAGLGTSGGRSAQRCKRGEAAGKKAAVVALRQASPDQAEAAFDPVDLKAVKPRAVWQFLQEQQPQQPQQPQEPPQPQPQPPQPQPQPQPQLQSPQPPQHGSALAPPARGPTIEPAAPDEVPTEAELHELFCTLDVSQDRLVCQSEMRGVIEHLETLWSLGLRDEDELCLFSYLCAFKPEGGAALGGSSAGGISREQFVAGIRRLAGLLVRLRDRGIGLQQMRIVLMAAFDRFDVNGDGEISLCEMQAAAQQLGVRVENEDISELYTFLLPKCGGKLTMDSLASKRSFKEKWIEASSRSVEQLRKKKGIDGIMALLGRVQKELSTHGDWDRKVQRGLNTAWDGIEDVCNFVELGVDVAGVGVALKYLGESFQEVVQNRAVNASDMAWEDILPFVALIGLGMMNTAKELDELVPKEMTEDEAQLYGQVFHPRGFSQADFRRLLGCPGFHWAWTEPGEVIHDVDDSKLRILVRGSAEVAHSGQQQPPAVLHPGSTFGETSFMQKRPLWTNEVVKARERMFFACWDHEKLREILASDVELSLRLEGVLTQTMMANFRSKVSLSKKTTRPATPTSRRPARAGSLAKLFESLDADRDGALRDEGQLLTDSTSQNSTNAATGMWMEGAVSKERLRRMLPALCQSLSLGDCDECYRRLSAFMDASADGLVDIEAFKGRLVELEECTAGLNGLSIDELESVVFHSFELFDTNGDGVMDEEEFMSTVERLRLPLSSEQAKRLFNFLDVDKDGCIQLSEWKANGGRVSWGDALRDSLQEQAEKKGLTKLSELLMQLCAIFTGEGDLMSKGRRAQKILVDGAESVADALTSAADASGVGAALCGIWREVSGVSSWEDFGDIDIAPFVIFFSILGISAVRRKAEGEVSNLAEAEAMLYATEFEKDGITVTDFQKLLKYGNARWETLNPGDIASGASDKSLKIIYSGTCEVFQPGTETAGIAGRGRILGASNFLGIDMEQVARAAEPTVVLSFEREALKEHLANDDSLVMRFNRVVTRSVVGALLDGGAAAHQS